LAAEQYRTTARLTTDADFMADNVPGLVEAFRDAGYGVRLHADPGEDPHLIMVRGKGEAIDILVPTVEYQDVALDRAVDHVLTVEDVIVHKLLAWRPRDRRDVESILDAGHELDESYIAHWAAEWGIEDRWAEVRANR
jgi:hypothetical protein